MKNVPPSDQGSERSNLRNGDKDNGPLATARGSRRNEIMGAKLHMEKVGDGGAKTVKNKVIKGWQRNGAMSKEKMR